MIRHLNNERQKGKTGHDKRRVLAGGGWLVKRA
jgi:hypothetical protein